jgi:hypothetical protein
MVPHAHWVVREKQASGVYVPVMEIDNLVTSFGLTALAAAPAGTYVSPIYLIIENSYSGLNAAGNIGDVTLQTLVDPTIVGDTQLVVGVGLASQETVTFTSKLDTSGVGAGPYVFSLTSGLANAHLITDRVVRAPTAADTMTSVLSEVQYDAANNPGQRVTMASSYSPGTGQNTMQFFLSGLTAQVFMAHVGLTDQVAISSIAANLHNYAALGYNNNTGADLEIDVIYTLTAV